MRACEHLLSKPQHRWGEQARVTAIKKLEKVASEGKFLLSHKNHWDRVSGTAGAMLRPKHRLEMADARDCAQEARENRITNQVPAVALESLGLRFWHRRCHAAAEGGLRPKAAAPRAASRQDAQL